MNTLTRKVFSLVALAAALLTMIRPGQAAEVGEVTDLAKPESTFSVGAGYVSDDNRRFGQYTGLRDNGFYGLIDLDLINRDEETGTWTMLEGRNLGLPNRDLRFEHNKQGDWKYFLEYDQTPRYEPFQATTAVSGIGTPNLTVPVAATAGVPVDLKTRRDTVGLGFGKQLPGDLDLQVRFRQQEKTGERIFARGTPGIFQFTPEPIDSTTRQIEATVGYTGKKLQLSGGYYGTAYDNHNTALNITETGGATALSGFTPIGLPPDNESHQLFLAGGYSFSNTTRGTFKAAYSRLTQNDSFILPSLPGRTDLGGKIDASLLQAGITARPAPKLSLLANLRYENRSDKTPVADYFSGASTTATGENEPRSIKTVAGKVEANYALPAGFRLTGGIEHDIKDRNFSAVRVVSAREETEETSYRLGLRRSVSETVTGSLTYIHSNRTGSDFLTTVLTTGAAGSNLIAPVHLADRDRDKVRLTMNWMPSEPLSFQLMTDYAQDDYSSRTTENLGIRKGKAENYALDATYVFSDTWQGSAWISQNKNRIDQASSTSGGQLWSAALRSTGDAFGLSLLNKPTKKLELGAELQYASYNDKFGQEAITGAAITSPPDINTQITGLQLTAKYALQKNMGVRVVYGYQRWSTDDWTWATWTYLDGTQLMEDLDKRVHFIGTSVYYNW